MEDRDWVTVRHRCSPFSVYTQLRAQVESDVAIRNKLREAKEETAQVDFRLDTSPDRFRVCREGNNISASVEFRWTSLGITVRNDNSEVILEGHLTVNDEGECLLKIRDLELAFWQFRRRALEDLFFRY